jgi:hypothetical protein
MQRLGISTGAILITYFLIGLAINAVQAHRGAPCDALLGEVHSVDLSEPEHGLRSLWWLPNLYEEVVNNKVSLGEYLSPTVCVTRPSAAVEEPRATES